MKIYSFRNEFFFLSNFYPVNIEIDGKTYASSEHYYQACKASDPEEHERIRKAPSAALTKKVAREIKSFDKEWHTNRIGVMKKALEAKFAIPELRDALLATDGFELEEGNWRHDDFWGRCTEKGQNMLGKMLMQIRENLKK